MVIEGIIDSPPELNKPLSAKYKQSFGYPTFTDREPQILDGICEQLKSEDLLGKHGADAHNDILNIIEKIQQLKTEMQTNHPLVDISCQNGSVVDKEISGYNGILKEKRESKQSVTWFQTEWLFAECYMYRRLNQIFKNSKFMQSYDPFMTVKINTLLDSRPQVVSLCSTLKALKSQVTTLPEEKRKDLFAHFLKCSLWGNKADLSLSGGKAVSAGQQSVESFDPYILVNDTEKVYKVLNVEPMENKVVDIVMDNAGYELFTDLIFADFLVWSGLAHTVTFHGKAIPWFVSDVTEADFNIIFKLLKNDFNDADAVCPLVDDWQKYVNAGTWSLKCDPFWVSSYDFSHMKSKSPELYSELSKKRLVIFKGDLNYRKLVGDIHWEPTTPFKEALQGFNPTNIVSLRTVKADTICGLPKGIAEKIGSNESDWMITGKYAVVQFSEKPN